MSATATACNPPGAIPGLERTRPRILSALLAAALATGAATSIPVWLGTAFAFPTSAQTGLQGGKGSTPPPPAVEAPTICPASGKGQPGNVPQAAPPPAPHLPGPGAGNSTQRLGVLDMDRVVGISLSAHPRVRQADADTAAADARLGQARSGRYPTINGVGSYTNFRTWSNDSTHDQWNAGGTLSHVIADFGRTSNSVDRSRSLLAAARENGNATREDVAYEARMAFLSALRAEKILGVRSEAVHQRMALLTQAKSYYDAGLRARIDVARAEANLYQARADLNAATNDVSLSRAALLERMGVDAPAEFTLAPSLTVYSFPGTTAEWQRKADESRPELSAARERVAAAEAALRQARSGNAPLLTGNAAAGYGGEDPLLRGTYSMGVLLTVPVFNGNLTTGQVRESEALLLSAKHAHDVLARQVRLQVEQSSLALGEAKEQIDVRRKQADAARENLQLAVGRYEAGAGDIIEMTDAQLQSDQAETSLVEALYDYNAAVATLRRSIGR